MTTKMTNDEIPTAGPNDFTPDDIERIKSDSFVSAVEFHRQLSSTNDLALRRAASKDLETPLLVLAEVQTAGRGRGGNAWWSARGALTFSLVIDAENYEPAGSFDPRLSLATALSLHDALSDWVPRGELKLKWPNDVYLAHRKVAGILLERPAARPDRLVVGIGVNVNNSLTKAPEHIRSIATSLYDATGQHHALRDVLRAILNRFAGRSADLAAGKLSLADEWREHCMLRNRTVHVASGNRVQTGVCHGVDDQGALILETGSEFSRLYSGTVEQVGGE